MKINPTHNPSILLICLGLLLGAWGCSSELPSAPELTAQADRVISLATQVAANLQATREVANAQAQATTQALESLAVQAELWPVVIEERFDDNVLEWPTGDGVDPLATILWEIRDHQYHWWAVAKEPFVWWTIPAMDPYRTFILAVDVHQIEGPPDGEAGLVFRETEGNYYLFEINGGQQYSFYLHNQDEWEAIQDWTVSDSISLDGPNRLSVIADRESFYLFVNDHYLTTLIDNRLASGSAGVLAGLSSAGDEGSWVFDNFVIQSKDTAAP